MSDTCPTHNTHLVAQGKLWFCAACNAQYRLRGTCATCNQELERLMACGATNWFCNHCNALQSKATVKFDLTPT